MVKACFASESKLSEAGDKDIYIRVIDQNNKTLFQKPPLKLLIPMEKIFH